MSDLGVVLIFVMVWPILHEYYGKIFRSWKDWFIKRTEVKKEMLHERNAHIQQQIEDVRTATRKEMLTLTNSINQIQNHCLKEENVWNNERQYVHLILSELKILKALNQKIGD